MDEQVVKQDENDKPRLKVFHAVFQSQSPREWKYGSPHIALVEKWTGMATVLVDLRRSGIVFAIYSSFYISRRIVMDLRQ
jgi:hypothetical protein